MSDGYFIIVFFYRLLTTCHCKRERKKNYDYYLQYFKNTYEHKYSLYSISKTKLQDLRVIGKDTFVDLGYILYKYGMYWVPTYILCIIYILYIKYEIWRKKILLNVQLMGGSGHGSVSELHHCPS